MFPLPRTAPCLLRPHSHGFASFDIIFPSSGRNLSFPSLPPLPSAELSESCLLLSVAHRLRAPQEKLSHSWPQPDAKHRPHLEPAACQTGSHRRRVSNLRLPSLLLPSRVPSLPPTPSPSRAPLPGHPGHGTGDTAGLGSPKEGTPAHGVGAHVLKDQPVPYV